MHWIEYVYHPQGLVGDLGLLPFVRGAHTVVEGIPVFVGQAGAALFPDAVKGVTSALVLIRKRDPRRLRRLQYDRVRITFSSWIGTSAYWPGLNAIALDLQQVSQLLPGELATVIVHEATHARLDRSGISTRRTGVKRIERRCIEEEIAFCRRFPAKSEEAWVRWVARKRDSVNTPWWSPKARRLRWLRAMERHGGPEWLITLARVFIRDDGRGSNDAGQGQMPSPS
jgi:hypothetical protein